MYFKSVREAVKLKELASMATGIFTVPLVKSTLFLTSSAILLATSQEFLSMALRINPSNGRTQSAGRRQHCAEPSVIVIRHAFSKWAARETLEKPFLSVSMRLYNWAKEYGLSNLLWASSDNRSSFPIKGTTSLTIFSTLITAANFLESSFSVLPSFSAVLTNL